MQLVSINVSLPVEVEHNGERVTTGIFKRPVTGPVRVGRINLEGDGQADPEHHGGTYKAVYAYSLDHYEYWRRVLDRTKMPHGQFGENLTVSGLDEGESCLGDRLGIGSAQFVITEPRIPCYKLGIRLEEERMPRLFSESARTGFYMSVVRAGQIEAGDRVEVLSRGRGRVPVKDFFTAYFDPAGEASADTLSRALQVPELPPLWRTRIEARLRGEDQ